MGRKIFREAGFSEAALVAKIRSLDGDRRTLVRATRRDACLTVAGNAQGPLMVFFSADTSEEDQWSVLTSPTGSDSQVDTGDQVVDRAAVPRGTSDSGGTEGAKANETVEESVSSLAIEGSPETPEMPRRIPAIPMPAGSEVWDENERNEFLHSDDGKIFSDHYNNAMMESPGPPAIVDILTNFADTGEDSHLDEPWDYPNELFPDNPEWAQEAFNGIMAGMDDWGFTESDPPNPSTRTENLHEQRAEIKPAATVT